jgi:hypothetical protein
MEKQSVLKEVEKMETLKPTCEFCGEVVDEKQLNEMKIGDIPEDVKVCDVCYDELHAEEYVPSQLDVDSIYAEALGVEESVEANENEEVNEISEDYQEASDDYID